MKTNISNHIKAGFPILSLSSPEETRIKHILSEVAEDTKRRFFTFSITSGIVDMQNARVDEDCKDPIRFLQFVKENEDKNMYLFLDSNIAIDDPLFQRNLKDILEHLKSNKKTIILLNVYSKVPSEMAPYIKSIDVPLPDHDGLKKVINDIISGTKITPENNEIEIAISSLSGLSTEQASDAVSLSLVESKQKNNQHKLDHRIIMREKTSSLKKDYFQVISKLPVLEDIGGLDLLKDWIGKRRDMFGERAKNFGLPMPKGVLMVGIPGCGKSLTAKTVATILDVPLIRLDMGAIMGSLVGESEKNAREPIKTAEAMAPCVLWIDELDKQLGSSGGQDNHEVTKRVMSSFLTWMQEKDSSVFVVATANNIVGLSQSFPEMLRKGRWDEIFFLDLPNTSEREKIFEIHIKAMKRDVKNYNLKNLACLSKDFSGAEIEAGVKEAMYIAFDKNREMEQNDIETAIKNTIPQSAMAKDSIKSLRTWCDTRARKASINDTNQSSARSIE